MTAPLGLIVVTPEVFFSKREAYRKANHDLLMVYYTIRELDGSFTYELRMANYEVAFKTIINEGNIHDLLVFLKILRLDEELDLVTMYQLLDQYLADKSLIINGFE